MRRDKRRHEKRQDEERERERDARKNIFLKIWMVQDLQTRQMN